MSQPNQTYGEPECDCNFCLYGIRDGLGHDDGPSGPLQLPACSRCSQGVMDADTMIREFDQQFGGYKTVPHFGNPHLYGRCECSCHGF